MWYHLLGESNKYSTNGFIYKTKPDKTHRHRKAILGLLKGQRGGGLH